MTRGRLLLIALSLWALSMIVPDLVRVVRPLSSYGFVANNDGVIYDVIGPFRSETSSPAWKQGIRAGDRLDLARMRCLPYDAKTCRDVLAAAGGLQFVAPGSEATFILEGPQGASREVTVAAEPRLTNWLDRAVLLLDQFAGIAVILAAAWLVWTRPGPMSWGFFLYVIWFNPGQSSEFYAQIGRWPPALLAQNVLACVAQGAAFAGLLLFVIRAPTDTLLPGWERAQRALPWIAAFTALALMGSYASAFGFKTETLTRATILFGFLFSIAAIAILLLRRSSLSPKDHQRLRWVLWGALVGLPAHLIGDLSQYTTLLNFLWGNTAPPQDVIGLLYLVNGILCLFVFEAVRRPRVVNVSIPLRRVTILAITMSLPALLLHREAEHMQEAIGIPDWAWLAIGAMVLFVIGRLHTAAVDLVEGILNRRLEKIEAEVGEAIDRSSHPEDIDHALADLTQHSLRLTSAATFRNSETGFALCEDEPGWSGAAGRALELAPQTTDALHERQSRALTPIEGKAADFPADLEYPQLAVPAASRVQCYAVTLYGPHDSGTDIDAHERQMLESIAAHAADAYAKLEIEALRSEVRLLAARRGAAPGIV